MPASTASLIIPLVARRIHTPLLHVGEVRLDPVEAHHARAVLRLVDGEAVELFDDAGNVADGTLVHQGAQDAAVRVERVHSTNDSTLRWVVAAAVPKGDRADWMVEKLSELGTSAFIPLATARSVVLPEGKNKRQRWARLATESAKQSRRAGVMRVEELTPLHDAVVRWTPSPEVQPAGERGWFLSTEPDAMPLREAIVRPLVEPFALFIGPEGGWTNEEIEQMRRAGLTPVGLTTTILRVETAAVAAAAAIAILGIAAGPEKR